MPLNNINLMGPNPAQPFDIQTQQAMLAQQMQIADAMIAAGLHPNNPVIRTAAGNPFGRDVANFGDPIARVMQSIIGNKMQNEVMGQQSGLAQELQRRTQADISTVMEHLTGGPSEPGVGPPTPEGVPPPDMPGRPPNFAAGVQSALGSSVPGVRAIGTKLVGDMPSPKDFLQYGKNFAPQALGAFNQNPSDPTVLAGRPEVQVADNMMIRKQDGTAKILGPAQTFRVDKEAIPGLPLNMSKQTGEAKGLSGGTTTPPAKIEEMLGAENVKLLGEGRKAYIEDIGRMQNISQIRSTLEGISPEKFGAMADFRNFMNKIAEVVGAKPLSETSNMENLRSEAGKLVLEKIRLLAPVDRTDVKTVQDIVGTEGLTKRGFQQVMAVLEQATARSMARHEAFVKDFPLPQGSSMNRESLTRMYAPAFSTEALPTPGVITPTGGGWKIEPVR